MIYELTSIVLDDLIIICSPWVFLLIVLINKTSLALARDNNVEQFKKLLELNKELNIDVNYKYKEENTALIYAVFCGNIEIVKLLLNYRDNKNLYIINPNIQNNNGETALIITVLKGYIEIAEFMIRSKEEEGRYPVNIDLEDEDWLTASDHAQNNNSYITTLLENNEPGQNDVQKKDHNYDISHNIKIL